MKASEILHNKDVADRLQGTMNAAPGRDSAEVSKVTLREAILALASCETPDAASVDLGLARLTIDHLKARLANAEAHIERLESSTSGR